MEDYNKIIESLGVSFIKAKKIKILHPLTIENFYDVENTLILPESGDIKFGKNKDVVKNGILFIPGGKMSSVTYGTGKSMHLTNDDFLTNRDRYFKTIEKSDEARNADRFSYITFVAKVFDSVNFFSSLDIPAFVIQDEKVTHLLKDVIAESHADNPGKGRVMKIATEYLVIEILRYILRNNLFVEQLATNSTYFKDPRLIEIFAYIKDNIGTDLSNKVLADIAHVSEDYVGQYFKMLTGINPQDYIEYQRMESAVTLLRTSKKSIRDIGKLVGYKDTAYFCRRFKMMFGIPAGKMRRRESLMDS